MAGTLVLIILVACTCAVYSLQLKKVLVLSRHNLRTPLTGSLSQFTSKQWPKWNADNAHLTPKGALLESYMGEYFSAWLKREGLFQNQCPDKNSVHIYANTTQRTKATARAFAEAAFPNCNISVSFKNSTGRDPIFGSVLRNDSDAFKQTVRREMEQNLNNTNLRDVYEQLNHIIDIRNSEICKEKGYCDLTKDRTRVELVIGEQPHVNGPLNTGYEMLDFFLMSFYEGFPEEDIAWGGIKNETQWRELTRITKQSLNVRFNLTTGARDLARPLLEYMKERFEDDVKFHLLVGHDSSICPVLASMGFESHFLPGQFELTPIGGKLVFQKWTDGANDFLKVEFVYQSSSQLRNAEKLSLDNPPKNVTMYLEGCPTDEGGYCAWRNYDKIVQDLIV